MLRTYQPRNASLQGAWFSEKNAPEKRTQGAGGRRARPCKINPLKEGRFG